MFGMKSTVQVEKPNLRLFGNSCCHYFWDVIFVLLLVWVGEFGDIGGACLLEGFVQVGGVAFVQCTLPYWIQPDDFCNTLICHCGASCET